MPRSEKQRRWESSEILDILNYLFINFDMCNSVYSKVHNMIKVMDDFLLTGKKGSNTCDILWQNKKVRDLVKEMCYKTKERKREKEPTKDYMESVNNITNKASTSQVDVPQMPFSIEAVNEIYDEQIKKVKEAEILASKSREIIETKSQEVRSLYEEISQRRSELVNLIELANSKLSELKEFSLNE
ncbi:hypothetical protein GLOIN_2v1722788 [Rhizophagus clarus]|uniref:Uncharacterized protein n=1 Tax=Rhizophagus clarus TaxID=94130 RepID=A0A8H3L1G8_9GLOM|nr:hypothetical protein GLOIN_2v1722788 [Rhizophagus clarus]